MDSPVEEPSFSTIGLLAERRGGSHVKATRELSPIPDRCFSGNARSPEPKMIGFKDDAAGGYPARVAVPRCSHAWEGESLGRRAVVGRAPSR
jgi:hypothetical protein